MYDTARVLENKRRFGDFVTNLCVKFWLAVQSDSCMSKQKKTFKKSFCYVNYLQKRLVKKVFRICNLVHHSVKK